MPVSSTNPPLAKEPCLAQDPRHTNEDLGWDGRRSPHADAAQDDEERSEGDEAVTNEGTQSHGHDSSNDHDAGNCESGDDSSSDDDGELEASPLQESDDADDLGDQFPLVDTHIISSIMDLFANAGWSERLSRFVQKAVSNNVTRRCYADFLEFADPLLRSQLPVKFDTLLNQVRKIIRAHLGSITSFVSLSGPCSFIPLTTAVNYWCHCPHVWSQIVTANTRFAAMYRSIIQGDLDPFDPEALYWARPRFLRKEAWDGDRFYHAIAEVRERVMSIVQVGVALEDIYFVHIAVHVDGFPFYEKGGSADLISLMIMEVPVDERSSGSCPSLLPVSITDPASKNSHSNETIEVLRRVAASMSEMQRHPHSISHQVVGRKFIFPVIHSFPADGKARNDLLCIASYGTKTRCCPYCEIKHCDFPRYAQSVAREESTESFARPRVTFSQWDAIGSSSKNTTLRESLRLQHGLTGTSVLKAFPGVTNPFSLCVLDLFHLEGEGECDKTLGTVGNVFGSVTEDFWLKWSDCLQQYSFASSSHKPPLFKSLRGWRYLLNGIHKLHTFLVAPFTMWKLVEAFVHGNALVHEAWNALIRHVSYLRNLYRRSMPSDPVFLEQLSVDIAEAKIAVAKVAVTQGARPEEFWTPNAHVVSHAVEQAALHSSLFGNMVTPFESAIHFVKLTNRRHGNGKSRNEYVVERLFLKRVLDSASERVSNFVESIPVGTIRHSPHIELFRYNATRVFVIADEGPTPRCLLRISSGEMMHTGWVYVCEVWNWNLSCTKDSVSGALVYKRSSQTVSVHHSEVTEIVEAVPHPGGSGDDLVCLCRFL